MTESESVSESGASSKPFEPLDWLWLGMLIVSIAIGLGLTWFGPN